MINESIKSNEKLHTTTTEKIMVHFSNFYFYIFGLIKVFSNFSTHKNNKLVYTRLRKKKKNKFEREIDSIITEFSS